MKYAILFAAVLATTAQAQNWGSYDNYLQHGWQHDAPHVVPHVLPHMHSKPHQDALAYPVYQQRQRTGYRPNPGQLRNDILLNDAW